MIGWLNNLYSLHHHFVPQSLDSYQLYIFYFIISLFHLLLGHHLLVENKFRSFQNNSITPSTLSRTRSNLGINTPTRKLVIKRRLKRTTTSLLPGRNLAHDAIGLLDSFLLLNILSLLDTNLDTVMVSYHSLIG
jgi:hypothetical protein